MVLIIFVSQPSPIFCFTVCLTLFLFSGRSTGTPLSTLHCCFLTPLRQAAASPPSCSF